MTREEAIQQILDLKNDSFEEFSIATHDAFDLAIAALRQPAEPREKLVRLPSGAWVRPSDVAFIDHDSVLLKDGRDRLFRIHGCTPDEAAAIINGETP